jgi:hypothetical protein
MLSFQALPGLRSREQISAVQSRIRQSTKAASEMPRDPSVDAENRHFSKTTDCNISDAKSQSTNVQSKKLHEQSSPAKAISRSEPP